MIGSTQSSYKHANLRKTSRLEAFVNEYSRVANIMVQEICDDLPENLSLPRFSDYKSFNVETFLTARVLQCAANQANGIVKSCIEKQRRRLWAQENHDPNVKDVKFSLPKEHFIGAQLNANCVNIELGNSKKFGGFVKLSSLGVEPIILPIDKTSQFFKWKNRGSRLYKAVKLFKKGFQLSWDYERIPKPQGSKVVGFDQGYKTVAALSDGQTTPAVDNHGHSLESVIAKLARRKKGSKSLKRAQAHRKNFVHWSINQLDLNSLKELRLEKVVNIGFRKKTSRKLSHWSNPEIRDKIKRRCEELEVPVVEQSCCYRSQRCSNCGLVRKANRKGKIYKCKSCGFESDSDLNAAKNHEVDLDPIPYVFRGIGLNMNGGFFWKPEGIFNLNGSELVVPNSHEKIFQ